MKRKDEIAALKAEVERLARENVELRARLAMVRAVQEIEEGR